MNLPMRPRCAKIFTLFLDTKFVFSIQKAFLIGDLIGTNWRCLTLSTRNCFLTFLKIAVWLELRFKCVDWEKCVWILSIQRAFVPEQPETCFSFETKMKKVKWLFRVGLCLMLGGKCWCEKHFRSYRQIAFRPVESRLTAASTMENGLLPELCSLIQSGIQMQLVILTRIDHSWLLDVVQRLKGTAQCSLRKLSASTVSERAVDLATAVCAGTLPEEERAERSGMGAKCWEERLMVFSMRKGTIVWTGQENGTLFLNIFLKKVKCLQAVNCRKRVCGLRR